MFDFTGKTVLITGATRGIGRAALESFASCHANVAYLYSYSSDVATAIDAAWADKEVKVKGYQCDVTDLNSVVSVMDQIIKEFTKIDILVNNAGITQDTYLMMMSEEAWKRVIDVNLTGVFHVTKQLMFHFIQNHVGTIVNVSSVAGVVGIASQTNYSASKAGIIGFTKSLAKEVASLGIRVNAVAPGFIETEMLNTIPEKLLKQYKSKIPLKTLGKKEDVVNAIMFLASEYAGYIQGEVLTVDGGLTA